MLKLIYADKFILENETKGPGYMLIEDGKFGAYTIKKPTLDVEYVDYSGNWIAPGLVDTHIHGYKGDDVMDNDFNGLFRLSENLLSCGVTSFLPTTLTSSDQQISDVVKLIGDKARDLEGAKVRGIYLEGPFFTEEHAGAQEKRYLMDPKIDLLKKWQGLANGMIKKIAIAPERKNSTAFIQYAVKEGITVSLGHSNATYEEAVTAIKNGASTFTHGYNGMSGLHHREPGMVGVALNREDVFVEVICDGLHVHPVAINILMKAREKKRMVIVSDCMRAGGLEDGTYQLGSYPINVENGEARLFNGRLAGSTLDLLSAVRNIVKWGIVTPEEGIHMATSIPAESIKMSNSCGKISEGLEADFIVLTPDLELIATYINGEKRYEENH